MIIMVGAPGSGKSSYVKEYVKSNDDTVVVSPDNVRLDMAGGDYGKYNFKDEGIVWSTVEAEVAAASKLGVDIIFDATNMCKLYRSNAIKMLKSDDYEINAVVMDTCRDTCVKRRTLDDKGASSTDWAGVIDRMFDRYIEPDISEGFSAIEHVKEQL